MHESIRVPLQSEDSDLVAPFPERGTLETQRPEESSGGSVAPRAGVQLGPTRSRFPDSLGGLSLLLPKA